MKKAIKLGLLISVMALIYYFSSEPSYDSTVTTNSFIQIIYNVYKFIFANRAISYELFCDMFFQPIRKLAHFSEFALLGLLIYINSKEYFKDKHILYSFIIGVLYAISDEIHQLFVPGRYCAFLDVIIDSSGTLCGILLIHLISKKCLKK